MIRVAAVALILAVGGVVTAWSGVLPSAEQPLQQASLAELIGNGGVPMAQPELSERARAALAEGNEHYRAGRYAAALAQYREAAREAPRNGAPYFGILMAAQKLGDAMMADSASRTLARLGEVDAGAIAHAGER